MNRFLKKVFWGVMLTCLAVIVFSKMVGTVYAKDPVQKPQVVAQQDVKQGMTLWQIIKSGGSMMFVLAGLSVAATAIIVYNFMTMNINIMAPAKFTEEVMQRLEKREGTKVEEMCKANPNIISNIVLSGLEKKKRGIIFARESMENCAKKEIGNLWQILSYLADIASIAPLVGLLGTVLGMIQAFNVVAFQTAVVKPVMLAGGVSKAMVTTAGGLLVAIPVMLFYSFFKGKVIAISNVVEGYSDDIIKIFEDTMGGR